MGTSVTRYAARSLSADFALAVEHWVGDGLLPGPWDDVCDLLARVVTEGTVTLDDAARLDHLLRRTRGDEGRAACGTCECPVPGLTHAEHS